MRTRTTLAATLAAAALLTACTASPSPDRPAKPKHDAAAPAASPTIPPKCRAWLEKELLDSSADIDATSGYAVCGQLSDEEMNRAIDEVTNDLEHQSATPDDATEQYGDGDYQVGKDIPTGTYETSGASSGGISFCAITTHPTGGKLPQVKSATKAGERIIITLDKGDGVVTVKGCEPLTPR